MKRSCTVLVALCVSMVLGILVCSESMPMSNLLPGVAVSAMHPADRSGANHADLYGFPKALPRKRSVSPTAFPEHPVATSWDGPRSLHAIDLDGDGDMDLVGAAYWAGEVAWWENDGNQGFANGMHIIATDFVQAESVYATDLDGDGDVDVLGAAGGSNEIRWWENDGDQNFVQHSIVSGYDAQDVFAIDLDGDSDTDVVGVSFSEGNSVDWWENNGSESFTQHAVDTWLYWPMSVFADDIDGDGDVDVLATTFYYNEINWYENDGSQGFTERVVAPSGYRSYSDASTIDIDGDGDLDVVSASSSGIAWWENDGSENFSEHTVSDSFSYARVAEATDFDSDGDLDIVASASIADEIRWWENDGNEQFTTTPDHVIASGIGFAWPMATADIDGDGDLDVFGGAFEADTVSWWEAGGFDLSIFEVVPVQVIEDQDLVQNKPTAVKVVVKKAGVEVVDSLAVRLTYNGTPYDRFWVADEENIDARVLKDDNQSYPLRFEAEDIYKTIYFIEDDLTPSGSSFQVEVVVDPDDVVAESNETNNTRWSDNLSVYETRWSGALWPDLYLHYVRADWDEEHTFNAILAPYNAFMQAVYPVAPERFTPDKSDDLVLTSQLFRGPDLRLDDVELAGFVRSSASLMNLAHPRADRYVAMVPPGWFSDDTWFNPGVRGMRYLLCDLILVEGWSVSSRNGEEVSTAAHEIGHSYGLPTGLPPLCFEEYKACNPGRVDGIGNEAWLGLWVDRRMPIAIHENAYCFMGASAAVSYWIDQVDYTKLFTDHSVPGTGQAPGLSTTGEGILAVGMLYNDGTASLQNWYRVSATDLSELEPGPYSFAYHDAGGNVIHEIGFDTSFVVEDNEVSAVPFVVTIPDIAGAHKIVITHNGEEIAQRPISVNPPQVDLGTPNGGEYSRQITVQWSASDLDGDELNYALLYSRNGGATWEGIAVDLAGSSYDWDVSALPPGTQYLVKIMATDGINTAYDVSNAAFTIRGSVYLPVVARNHMTGTPPVNNPPHTPSSPFPADGATGQSIIVDLGWAGGDPDGDTVTYDVYFEAGDSTPDVLVCDDTASSTCDPGTLSYDTQYYWQVVARDEHGATMTGPVWNFASEPDDAAVFVEISSPYTAQYEALEGLGTAPLVETGDVSGEIVYVGTGCVDSLGDTYLADPNDKVALIQRGGCSFAEKIQGVEAAGALAAIVFNNAGDSLTTMVAEAGIPAVFIGQTHGEEIVAAPAPVMGGLVRVP